MGRCGGWRTAASERRWALRRQAINDGAAVQCTGVSDGVRAAGVVGRQMLVSDRTGAANSSASGFGENGGELKTKKGIKGYAFVNDSLSLIYSGFN